jgi:hypothetical protein
VVQVVDLGGVERALPCRLAYELQGRKQLHRGEPDADHSSRHQDRTAPQRLWTTRTSGCRDEAYGRVRNDELSCVERHLGEARDPLDARDEGDRYRPAERARRYEALDRQEEPRHPGRHRQQRRPVALTQQTRKDEPERRSARRQVAVPDGAREPGEAPRAERGLDERPPGEGVDRMQDQREPRAGVQRADLQRGEKRNAAARVGIPQRELTLREPLGELAGHGHEVVQQVAVPDETDALRAQGWRRVEAQPERRRREAHGRRREGPRAAPIRRRRRAAHGST